MQLIAPCNRSLSDIIQGVSKICVGYFKMNNYSIQESGLAVSKTIYNIKDEKESLALQFCQIICHI